jgi:RHS repeat-associated protein
VRKRHMVLTGRHGRFRRPIALGTALAVGLSLLVPLPASAAPQWPGKPKTVDHERPVKGRHAKVRPSEDLSKGLTTKPLATPVWPSAGTAEVAVPPAGKQTQAGRLPVWVQPPARQGQQPRTTTAPAGEVRIQVVDQKLTKQAGLEGLVLTVERTDAPTSGQVRLGVDYSQFATAFGGSYGSRLQLVQYPACILATPERTECRAPIPLPTDNNSEARTVTAQVTAPAAAEPGSSPTTSSTQAQPMVLAVQAAPSGDKGDWTATPLEASSTFDVQLNSGDFVWSYPMRVPPVPSGLAPNVGISYSAGSVDGKTAATGAQASWVGDGFELWPGFIERRYKSCEDDGAPKDEWENSPGDKCWGYDNATVTWNGKGGELVHESGTTWRLKKDDGTRFDKLSDGDVGNGDDDGEYWRVTTLNGTRYYFGSHKGADGQKPATASAWTVPVFGDDDKEPCHKTTGFKDSWCQQAWRWNLDYVVDRDGNVITYYYNQEKNHYGRNLEPTDETEYVRGGTLDRIEYGLREGQLTAKPAARVMFTTAERCLGDETFNCDPAQIDTHRQYWQDTPWDLHCNSGQDCQDNHGVISPTFWTKKRLTKVTTQAIKSDATYRDVDIWTITHEFGKADIDATLLPRRIQHTGAALSPAITEPEVRLDYWPYANRVDKTGNNLAPYLRHRLIAIFDESGGKTAIEYAPTQCNPAALPTPETNTKRCFPVFWQHGTATDPTMDWFHKYVVARVRREDRTGLSAAKVTEYRYDERTDSKGAAWHYDDDDGITPEKYKSWAQWRGYEYVSVRDGTADAPETRTDHYFLRGMDGDRLNKADDKRQVTVSDGAIGNPRPIEDKDAWAGHEYRSEVFDGPAGIRHSQTVTRPWSHQTASRTRPWGTVSANLTGVDEGSTRKLINPGPNQWWQHTRIDNLEFDLLTGAVLKSEDRGAEGEAGDERCTTTKYTHNTTDWLVAYPSQITTVAAPCNQEYDPRTQTISDIRTSYDNAAWGTAPTKGKATYVAQLSPDPADPLNGTPTFRRVGATVYGDAYGRATEITDALGRISKISYTQTPAPSATVQGLTTQTTNTPPAVNGVTLPTTITYNAAWGVPSAKVDVGGQRSEGQYDALGRLTKVWRPDRSRTLDKPSIEYSYQLEAGKIVAIGTRTPTNNGGQTPYSWQLYDGLLRPVQTQVPGPNGGRVITDTFYNARGLVYATYGEYYNDEAAPTPALFVNENDGQIKSQIRYSHDGLGRVTREALMNGPGLTTELWASTTSYGGNWVHTEPPSGGTPTTVFYDARGQQTELQQFNPDGSRAATTSYRYDGGGRLTKVIAPGGLTYENVYDLLGRTVKTIDPDKGTTEFGYDDLGQQLWAKDARGQKVTTEYDVVGRPKRTLDNAGNPLKSWVYDTLRPGQPTSSTRHAPGPNGATLQYTERVDIYDPLNRPVRTTITIPDAETGLKGEYQYNTAYNPDGTVQSVSTPAAGGLPAETLVTGYNDLQQPITLDGITSYVTGTAYSNASRQLLSYELATGGTALWVNHEYDDTTKRLTRSQVQRYQIDGYDRDAHYTYDDAGNITQISDKARTGTDTQCFRYDGLRRLKQAWTPDSTGEQPCKTDPSLATIAGPAPYRIDYTYDDTTGQSGNRTAEVQFTAGANGGTQTATRTYSYAGGPGIDPSVKGHMLGAVTQNGNSAISGPAIGERYTYNPDGSTKIRALGTVAQEFTYDAEGEISRITEKQDANNTAATTFVYTATGSRLLRRDPSGTTLYLPGMEVRNQNGQTTATRYYSHAGQTVAMRTGSGATFLAGDHQGTSQLAISSTQITTPGAISQRRYTPFGQERGTPTTSWPTAMDKGFVGGTKDPTKTPGLKPLTQLGARPYDPNNGRFLSVDPIIDFSDSQQINGYTYANNSPITLSDPTGLCTEPCAEGFAPAGSGGSGGGGGSSGGDSDRGGGGSSGNYENANYVEDLPELYTAVGLPFQFKCLLLTCGYKGPTTGDILRGIPGFAFGAGAGIVQAFLDITASSVNKQKEMVNQVTNGWVALAGGAVGASGPGYTRLPPSKPVQAPQVNLGPKSLRNSAQYKFGRSVGQFLGPPIPGAGAIKAPAAGRRLLNLLKGCRRSSFLAGTGVAMADGTHKPIEKLVVGDKVITTDPATGNTRTHVVQATISSQGPKDLVQVTVDTDGPHGNKTGRVTATDEHPFWVTGTLPRWTPAKDLRPGMELRTSTSTRVQITGIKTWAQNQRVHNLTISTDHTFHVQTGSAAVLVHNECGNTLHAADCYCNWGEPVVPRSNAADEVDEFTSHAMQRMVRRGVSEEDARAVLDRDPFSYWHGDQWKLGYYDPNSRVFVAKTIDGNVNTVITDVNPSYIDHLKDGR